MLERAGKTICGIERRFRGAYTVLIELMHNTNNHASGTINKTENWWLSVTHNHKEKIVSISFVDYGVGIFESLNSKSIGDKFFESFMQLLKLKKENHELLALILKGELHKTSTGQPNRGKGLPGIYSALERQQIADLVIITNDVIANVSENTYKKLDKPFSGTFIHWHLNDKCQNHPVETKIMSVNRTKN